MDLTWLQKLKVGATEMILKRIGPAAGASLVSLLAAFVAAHNDLLESWGVNYIPDFTPAWLATHSITGHVIILELDTTGAAAWALIGAAIVGFVYEGGHHTTTFIKGTPTAPQAPSA